MTSQTYSTTLESNDKACLQAFFKDLEKNLSSKERGGIQMLKQQYSWMQKRYPGFVVKEIEELCLLYEQDNAGKRAEELCIWLKKRAYDFLHTNN